MERVPQCFLRWDSIRPPDVGNLPLAVSEYIALIDVFFLRRLGGRLSRKIPILFQRVTASGLVGPPNWAVVVSSIALSDMRVERFLFFFLLCLAQRSSICFRSFALSLLTRRRPFRNMVSPDLTPAFTRSCHDRAVLAPKGFILIHPKFQPSSS